MGTVDAIFRNSCIPFEVKTCAVGTKLINPCVCDSYYECDTGFHVIERPCATGTWYHHIEGTCKAINEIVVHGICSHVEPWLQCENKTGVNIPAITKRCGGTVTTTPAPVTSTVGEEGENNAGLIAGLVVGFAIVLILVVVLIIYFMHNRRNRDKKGKTVTKSPSVMNPGYAAHEDEYARVDDFRSPVYTTETMSSPPELPNRPPSHQTQHVNGKLTTDTEHGYVEPNFTLKTVDKSQRNVTDAWTDSTYSDIIDHNDDKDDNCPAEEPPTPYDNRF